MSTDRPPFDSFNRRRRPRLAARPTTRVICRSGRSAEGDLCLRVLDLSREGARLLLSRELPVGAEAILVFISPSLFSSERCQAEVVWQSPDEQGGFLTGLRFRRPLARFALRDFVVPATGSSSASRRAAQPSPE
jgi:hypothetical protein